MTLEGAIEHVKEVIKKLLNKTEESEDLNKCLSCATEHIELQNWLMELKEYRRNDIFTLDDAKNMWFSGIRDNRQVSLVLHRAMWNIYIPDVIDGYQHTGWPTAKYLLGPDRVSTIKRIAIENMFYNLPHWEIESPLNSCFLCDYANACYLNDLRANTIKKVENQENNRETFLNGPRCEYCPLRDLSNGCSVKSLERYRHLCENLAIDPSKVCWMGCLNGLFDIFLKTVDKEDAKAAIEVAHYIGDLEIIEKG